MSLSPPSNSCAGGVLSALCAGLVILSLTSLAALHTKAWAEPVVPMAGKSPPAIDGMLDDPVWRTALTMTDFVSGGSSPDDAIEARLVQNRSTLFVSVRVRAQILVADGGSDWASVWQSDWVALAIDSRGGGLGAWFFLLTPDGRTLDGVLDASGRPTPVPLTRWRGGASRDPNGFAFEFAIPLAALPRYAGTPDTLGLRIIRHNAVRGSESELALGQPSASRFRTIDMATMPRSRLPRESARFELVQEVAAKRDRARSNDVSTLAGRVVAFGDASVADWQFFPSARLAPSRSPFRFQRRLDEIAIATRFEGLTLSSGRTIGDINRFLDETGTTALLVIKDGAIEFERYLNGFRTDSVFTSFSTAKSFVSTLIGMAIDKGFIGSETDSIVEYVPELLSRDPRFAKITIADLMHMASGLAYVEDGYALRDDHITYMDPDLRTGALTNARISEPANTRWLYNNYNPILLGMVLERVTGKTITQLTQDWLWTPMGAERDASWSLDSNQTRFEKMESGLNSTPRDYAKLCALYMATGSWRGEQLLSPRFIDLATQPYDTRVGADFYGWFWWLSPRTAGRGDFYAQGNKGQYIYCSPQKDLIIVRTGIRYGLPSPSDWPVLFRALADTW